MIKNVMKMFRGEFGGGGIRDVTRLINKRKTRWKAGGKKIMREEDAEEGERLKC